MNTRKPFAGSDDDYYAWLAGHPNGFVVNTYHTPNPNHLFLHRATCYHIQRWEGRTSTCGKYSKMCAESEQELLDWAASLGGTPTWCSHCHRTIL
jgi:hypothetical protein